MEAACLQGSVSTSLHLPMRFLILGCAFLSMAALDAEAATALPTPPPGSYWRVVSTGNLSSDVVDATSVEASMEASVGLNATDTTDIQDTSGLIMESLTFDAFDCTTAPADFIYLVTSNTYSANLSVSSSAYASGPQGSLVLVNNVVNDVQVVSVLGTSVADSSAASNGGSGGFVITPTATASSGISGSLSYVNGETVTVSLSASVEVDVIGLTSPSEQLYGNLPNVDISLRRDTVYDVYELVPEPSFALLMPLGLGLFLRRKRMV